jgi:nucleoside-diphosphate kinase
MINKFLSFFLAFAFFSAGTVFAEETLSIIKPDAVEAQRIGSIIETFEEKGLKIAALKMTKLTTQQAQEFYKEHAERPFYKDLVKFMTSGPVVLMVLEGDNAIVKNREIMGVTNPEKADAGTLRARFGTDVEKNAVHGSDTEKSAMREIRFFFNPKEIYAH